MVPWNDLYSSRAYSGMLKWLFQVIYTRRIKSAEESKHTWNRASPINALEFLLLHSFFFSLDQDIQFRSSIWNWETLRRSWKQSSAPRLHNYWNNIDRWKQSCKKQQCLVRNLIYSWKRITGVWGLPRNYMFALCHNQRIYMYNKREKKEMSIYILENLTQSRLISTDITLGHFFLCGTHRWLPRVTEYPCTWPEWAWNIWCREVYRCSMSANSVIKLLKVTFRDW